MSGDAEVGPLAVDVAAISSGVRSWVDNRRGVTDYVAAMVAVPLGPQPIVVPGMDAFSYDPLGKRPELARRLREAQVHAEWAARSIDNLQDTLSKMGGAVAPELAIVHDLVESVPPGAPLPADKAQQIRQTMFMVRIYTNAYGAALSQSQDGVIGFLGQLGADHAALVDGNVSIAQVKQQIVEDGQAAMLPLVLDPTGRGIAAIIGQIGGRLVAALDAVGATLRGALEGHEGMRGGLSALASAVQTIASKHSAAADATNRADSAALPLIVRKLFLANAIASWQQLAAFVTNSGLSNRKEPS